MKITSALLATSIISTSLFLTACNDKQATTDTKKVEVVVKKDAVNKADLIAIVNGVSISKLELQNAMTMRTKEGKKASANIVLQEMINLEILNQEAKKQGITELPLIKAEIKRQSTAVVANQLIKNQFKDLKITDDQLHAEYDQQIAKLPQSEYKARHILLKNEDDAKSVIADLDKGIKFEKLAKEKSTGPSGKNGGDLGWFQAHTMVPEFASAVKTMTKGKYSKSPVKTQFGFHVIFLEDTRVIPGPSFEDVKDKIQTIIVNKMLKGYLATVTKDAQIEIIQQAKPAVAPASIETSKK